MNRTLNNKGIMSILSIILVITIVLVASGLVTIMERNMAISEVQGIMDTSGLMALRHGVDKDLFRMEIIEVDASKTTQHYRSTMNRNLSTMPSIKDFEVRTVRVHAPDSPALKELGIPDGERGQYYLESLIVVYMHRMNEFGPSDNVIWSFYDLFDKEEAGRKEVRAEKVEGQDALILRSVTRMVLR